MLVPSPPLVSNMANCRILQQTVNNKPPQNDLRSMQQMQASKALLIHINDFIYSQ